MQPIAEGRICELANDADGAHTGEHGPLETLTSGLKRDIKCGSLQAHICVVGAVDEVDEVVTALQQADAFRNVANWSYAYRLVVDSPGSVQFAEAIEDGNDVGCGERILSVLRRYKLHGLLLVMSRWHDYGLPHGMEIYGTELYSLVNERCRDLITHLNKAVGIGERPAQHMFACPTLAPAPPSQRKFDFGFLPPLADPRPSMKYGPNHFLTDHPLNKSSSLPSLFSASNGGDVRLWIENDKHLRELPESELFALRALRQPDQRIERIMQAISILRGQKPLTSGTAAARWGHCKELLRSPTFRTELLLLDAAQVPLHAAQSAFLLLDGIDVEDVRRSLPAAAALFEWAQGVARWCINPPPAANILSHSCSVIDEVPVAPLKSKEASFAYRHAAPATFYRSPVYGARKKMSVPVFASAFA